MVNIDKKINLTTEVDFNWCCIYFSSQISNAWIIFTQEFRIQRAQHFCFIFFLTIFHVLLYIRSAIYLLHTTNKNTHFPPSMLACSMSMDLYSVYSYKWVLIKIMVGETEDSKTIRWIFCWLQKHFFILILCNHVIWTKQWVEDNREIL